MSESNVRAYARRRGYGIRKSRGQRHMNNRGEYMLTEVDRNWIVLGERFDASLDEIMEYLRDKPLQSEMAA